MDTIDMNDVRTIAETMIHLYETDHADHLDAEPARRILHALDVQQRSKTEICRAAEMRYGAARALADEADVQAQSAEREFRTAWVAMSAAERDRYQLG